MAADDTATADGSPPTTAPRYPRLRRWNAAMAVLHLVQGALMVVQAEDVFWPITRTQYEFGRDGGRLVRHTPGLNVVVNRPRCE
jgi:hypothetical protein